MGVTGWSAVNVYGHKIWEEHYNDLEGGERLQRRMRIIQQQARDWKGQDYSYYPMMLYVEGYPAGTPGLRTLQISSSRFRLGTPPPRTYKVEFAMEFQDGWDGAGPERLYVDNMGFPGPYPGYTWKPWAWPFAPWMLDRVWTVHPVWLYRDLSWLMGRISISALAYYFVSRYHYRD